MPLPITVKPMSSLFSFFRSLRWIRYHPFVFLWRVLGHLSFPLAFLFFVWQAGIPALRQVPAVHHWICLHPDNHTLSLQGFHLLILFLVGVFLFIGFSCFFSIRYLRLAPSRHISDIFPARLGYIGAFLLRLLIAVFILTHIYRFYQQVFLEGRQDPAVVIGLPLFALLLFKQVHSYPLDRPHEVNVPDQWEDDVAEAQTYDGMKFFNRSTVRRNKKGSITAEVHAREIYEYNPRKWVPNNLPTTLTRSTKPAWKYWFPDDMNEKIVPPSHKRAPLWHPLKGKRTIVEAYSHCFGGEIDLVSEPFFEFGRKASGDHPYSFPRKPPSTIHVGQRPARSWRGAIEDDYRLYYDRKAINKFDRRSRWLIDTGQLWGPIRYIPYEVNLPDD